MVYSVFKNNVPWFVQQQMFIRGVLRHMWNDLDINIGLLKIAAQSKPVCDIR